MDPYRIEANVRVAGAGGASPLATGFCYRSRVVLSLPLVLHEAERHSVDEIVIEPGQPVTFHGEQGALVLGDSLREAEISDALSQLLEPEQQAELAVAGLVAFFVEGHDAWSLVAESAADGIVIRGRVRRHSPSDSMGMPLELPPFERFESDAAEIPQAPVSALRQSHARATRWDVAVAGSVLEPIPAAGSGALVDETLSGVGNDPRGAEPARAPASARGPAAPHPDSIDFALVGPPGSAEMPAAAVEHVEPRMPRQVATRPTMRGDDTLAMHIDRLEAGTVVFLAGIGVGERLLQHLEDGFEVVDLDNWDVVTTRPFEEMAATGAGYLVRLEDPSRCLAWLLRRLEEGARVVVETRSRSGAGARRVLLGAEATPHVVEWLDAHVQLWLHAERGTWVIEPIERA